MTVRTGLFRYARWHDLGGYLSAGWMVVGDLGLVHGAWSILMWHCECGECQP